MQYNFRWSASQRRVRVVTLFRNIFEWFSKAKHERTRANVRALSRALSCSSDSRSTRNVIVNRNRIVQLARLGGDDPERNKSRYDVTTFWIEFAHAREREFSPYPEFSLWSAVCDALSAIRVPVSLNSSPGSRESIQRVISTRDLCRVDGSSRVMSTCIALTGRSRCSQTTDVARSAVSRQILRYSAFSSWSEFSLPCIPLWKRR